VDAPFLIYCEPQEDMQVTAQYDQLACTACRTGNEHRDIHWNVDVYRHCSTG